MAKIRVYKLAKELGLTNAELLEKLAALDIEAKNHMSTISDEEDERVRAQFVGKEEPKPEIKVEDVRIKGNIIRRRRKVEVKPPPVEEPPEPPPEEAEPPPSLETEMPSEQAMAASPEGAAPATDLPLPEPEAEEQVARPEKIPEAESKSEPLKKLEPPSPAESERAEKGEKGKEKGKKAVEGRPSKGRPKIVEEGAPPGKRGRGAGRKVVEYRVGKRGEVDPERQFEGRRPRRTAVDVRKERKAPSRVAQKTMITVPKSIKRKVRMGETILVGELAKRLSVRVAEIIKKLMQSGIMVSINQAIDIETATLIASEYQFEVERLQREEDLLVPEAKGEEEALENRPPVVTIMGHVNHGKTRLLDAIRKTKVMESEAGGITQHIGAYTVEIDDKTIVFLDTPGHEAFTMMRSRGAQVTDIVVLVVAADDGLMPQTIEAINHAKAAKVPIIVAINKMDLPNVNMDKARQGLAEHELVPEDWGGETLCAGVSAKEETGINELLEMILLQAEMLELKANSNKRATGIIIEARLDRTLGPVATVLVESGTLRAGDPFVPGVFHGRVRALLDDRAGRVEEAGPSLPVEVIGWSGVPEAGDPFYVVEDERKAKTLTTMRQEKVRQEAASSQGKVSLEDLFERMQQEDLTDLNIVLKGDVQGSIEALAGSLTRLSNEEVSVKILHSGVGGVTETDVILASASGAIIIGFNVRAEIKALNLAEQEKVEINFYTVIYDAVSDVQAALMGMMKPVFKEVLLGHAEVRETFSISKIGTIAGSHVLDGKIERNSKVRVLRDSIVVHEGKLASLKRFKDDVKEVAAGYECGIRMESFNDVKMGDVLEAYIMEKVNPVMGEGVEKSG